MKNNSQSSLNYTIKRESFNNQENLRKDKLDQVKRILGLKETSEVKVYLIEEIVNGKKEGKILEEKEVIPNV